jgi:hypothetical protein
VGGGAFGETGFKNEWFLEFAGTLLHLCVADKEI